MEEVRVVFDKCWGVLRYISLLIFFVCFSFCGGDRIGGFNWF